MAEQKAESKDRPKVHDERMDREASDKTRAVMGYDKDGGSRVFNLIAGEDLPPGWADHPPPGKHPAEQESRR